METKKIIGILLLLLLFAGGWYYLTVSTVPAPKEGASASESESDGKEITGQKVNVGGIRGIIQRFKNMSDSELISQLEQTRTKINNISEQLSNAVRTGVISKISPEYKRTSIELADLKTDFNALQGEAIYRGLTIS